MYSKPVRLRVWRTAIPDRLFPLKSNHGLHQTTNRQTPMDSSFLDLSTASRAKLKNWTKVEKYLDSPEKNKNNCGRILFYSLANFLAKLKVTSP